jgi:hypothetical protein
VTSPQVRYRQPQALPPEFYESSRARIAMGERDVQGVFLVLGRLGISQRHIAALTGQSQSEISEIRAGRRVQSIDLIADGLRTPRGWWGLAHSDDALPPEAIQPQTNAPTATTTPASRAAPTAPPTPSSGAHPTVSVGRIAATDLAAARHLLGLISALRTTLAPRTAPIRPSRASNARMRRSARARRAGRQPN